MTEQELQQYLIKQYPKEPHMGQQGQEACGRNSLHSKVAKPSART